MHQLRSGSTLIRRDMAGLNRILSRKRGAEGFSVWHIWLAVAMVTAGTLLPLAYWPGLMTQD